MNEEAMSPKNKERLLTSLSLMEEGTLKVNVCLCDELLAAFIEGELTGKARQAVLAHLNHCPSCYYHWLEAASYLNELEPAAPRTSTVGSLSSIWQRFEPWFTGWKMAIPAAAVALVCLLVWWPASPRSPQQTDQHQLCGCGRPERPGACAHRARSTPAVGEGGARLQ